MIHDPLCWLSAPNAPKDAKFGPDWCDCDFIAEMMRDMHEVESLP